MGKDHAGVEAYEATDDAPTYTTQRMHDALCPAYTWPDVTKAYPGLESVADAVDPTYFNDAIIKAAETGDTSGIVWAGTLKDNADLIVGGYVEPAMLADAHADLTKAAFGPPPNPGDYHRGYIGAGHAPLTAPTNRTPMIPPAVHTIHPDDFHRGLLTEGHEAASPGDESDNNPIGATLAMAARELYGAASRAATENTMKALHDHIMAAYPDSCVMAHSRPVIEPTMGAANRPAPTNPALMNSLVSKSTDEPAVPAAGLTKKQLAKIVKNAVAEATTSLHTTYQAELDAMRAEIDDLGAQPDPTYAPIRGAVTKAQTTAPVAVPVERISLVEQAQLNKAAEEAEYIAYVSKMAGADNPNPASREQAEELLGRLLTKAS